MKAYGRKLGGGGGGDVSRCDKFNLTLTNTIMYILVSNITFYKDMVISWATFGYDKICRINSLSVQRIT
jgi:hypothetical protein